MRDRKPYGMEALAVGAMALMLVMFVLTQGSGLLGGMSDYVGIVLVVMFMIVGMLIMGRALLEAFTRLSDMFGFFSTNTNRVVPAHVAPVVADCCVRLGISPVPSVRTLPTQTLNGMAMSRSMLMLSEGLIETLPVEQLRIVIAHLLCRWTNLFGGVGDAGVTQPTIEGDPDEVLSFETHLELAITADLRVLKLFLEDAALRKAYEHVLRGDHRVDSPELLSLAWFAWPGEGGEGEYDARISALREAAGASGASW